MKPILAALRLLGPTSAIADVADSSPSGFTVKVSTHIQAAPADVYRKLVHKSGRLVGFRPHFLRKRSQPQH